MIRDPDDGVLSLIDAELQELARFGSPSHFSSVCIHFLALRRLSDFKDEVASASTGSFHQLKVLKVCVYETQFIYIM